MDKVIKSKNPSIRELERYSKKLYERYKVHVAVECSARCYTTGLMITRYEIYAADNFNRHFESWPEAKKFLNEKLGIVNVD